MDLRCDLDFPAMTDSACISHWIVRVGVEDWLPWLPDLNVSH